MSFETVRQIRHHMERPHVSFADEAARHAGADGAASSTQDHLQPPPLVGQQTSTQPDNAYTEDQAAEMPDDKSSVVPAASEGLSAFEAQDKGTMLEDAIAWHT